MQVVSSGGTPEDQAAAAILQLALNGELDGLEWEAADDQTPALTEDQVWRSDAYENLTHIQSGATCPLTWGDYTRTKVSMFLPDGMDVGCNYETGGNRFMTFYVYKSGLALNEELEGTMETLKARQPVSREAPFSMPSPLSNYVAATLAYEMADGTKMRTSTFLANGGAWRLKIRLTAPARDAVESERMAAIALMGQRDRLDNPQPPAPAPAPI